MQPDERRLSHETQHRIRAARAAFAELDRLKIRALEQLLLHAIARDDMTADPDGFPSGHESSAMVLLPDDERGVKLTSPERAASALLAGHVRDEHHEQTLRAISALARVLSDARTLKAALDLIEIRRDAEPRPTELGCESCARAEISVVGEFWGNVAGRLPRDYWLCGPCYDFVRRVSDRLEVEGGPRLPTVDELVRHARSGTWKIRATP